MPYICPNCKKTKKLPDFCCGTSMVPTGVYYCSTCGNQSMSPGNCCENPMKKL